MEATYIRLLHGHKLRVIMQISGMVVRFSKQKFPKEKSSQTEPNRQRQVRFRCWVLLWYSSSSYRNPRANMQTIWPVCFQSHGPEVLQRQRVCPGISWGFINIHTHTLSLSLSFFLTLSHTHTNRRLYLTVNNNIIIHFICTTQQVFYRAIAK